MGHDGSGVPGPPIPLDPTQNFVIDSDLGAERLRRAPCPHFKLKPLESESKAHRRERGAAF
jgi:hypothetical protein